MKNLAIFDNGGKTFDRFTIINKKDGEIIGASEMPFNPLGFGQYCGNVAWDYFTRTVRANFMRRIEKEDPKHYQRIVKDKTAEIIKEFKNEGNLGKLIPFNMLPPDVQKFAKQSFQ